MNDRVLGTVAPLTVDWGRDVGGLWELPGWAVELFVVLTNLGDSWVLFGLAVLTYLAYDRNAGGFVGGTVLAGLATTYALKAWFALPRPPEALHGVAVTGYGFPSGHAVGAMVGWGALAIALDGISTAPRRAIVAGMVVAAVAISRVAIRVHFLVDIVAGIAVGLVVLAVAWYVGRDTPLGLFGLGTVIALVAVALPASGWESVALLGIGVGAVVAWQLIEPDDRPLGRWGIVAIAAIGGVGAVAIAVADPVTAVAYVGTAVATIAVLALPTVHDRWLGAESTRQSG